MRQEAAHILVHGFCTVTALYIPIIGKIMLMHVEKNE